MIEFKGECGHTIRARDEDAGKVVRCSYCGREAMVTQEPQDELESLFGEMELTGEYDARTTKLGQKAARDRVKTQNRAASGKPATAFDPFSIAVKMIYAAVIIIAVVVVVKYTPGLYDKLRNAGTQTPPPVAATEQGPEGASSSARQRHGLLNPRLSAQQEGVFVSTVPSDAMVFCLPKHGVRDTIIDDPAANKNIRTPASVRLNPGKYTIAVALRINNSDLMRLPGYVDDLRRKVESNEFDNDALLAEYMIPDGCTSTFVATMRNSLYLVRTYEIEVESKSWTPITGLFLPKSTPLGKLIEADHLPQRKTFSFDMVAVERELDFYGVPSVDQKYIIDALKRIGKAYWLTADQRYRLFQIDLRDGQPTSKELDF